MKKLNWRAKLGVGLVLLSAALYFAHWLVFRDAHHIFIYMVGDIAFLPLEVLLVTMVIHALLEAHDKRSLLQKMNMVIGAFFTQVGTRLLGDLAAFDTEGGRAVADLGVRGDWAAQQFRAARQRLRGSKFEMDARRGDLEALRDALAADRAFLLGLLQNPNLLEHDAFTDLLWAVTHLAEELACRSDLRQLSDADAAHLSGDIRRAYSLLIGEWLDYMSHLKSNYPYLFSLAVRTNPFDANARPEVQPA